MLRLDENMDFVVNPLTKRKVKIGSQVYRKLVKDGHVIPQVVNIPNAPQPKKKSCPKGEVLNPITQRCIKINGAIYKRLKGRGIKFHEEDIQDIINPAPIQKPDKNCKNKETFLLRTETDDIDEADLIILPSGYCFSISELTSWLATNSFDNRDPYDLTKELFTQDNKATWSKHPELAAHIEAFFKDKQEKRQKASEVIYKNLDMLYRLGDTGRVCAFDVYFSHNDTDSSTFEYSIASLQTLSEALNSLSSKHVRDTFWNLDLEGFSVQSLMNDANAGRLCIHGVGFKFIRLFIHYFRLVEKEFKVKYEPQRCGLYFIKSSKYKQVLTINSECRLCDIRPESTRYLPYMFNIKPSEQKSSMVWTEVMARDNGITKLYDSQCSNESYLATNDASDSWAQVPDWRKFQTHDKYCFDLFFLIKSLTDQLNTCRNTNPYPLYPMNIFTRAPLTFDDLNALHRRIRINYITIARPLMLFLENKQLLWSEDNAYTRSSEWRETCVDFFERNLNYVRFLAPTDEVASLTGFWRPRSTNQSRHEQLLLDYLATANENYLARYRRYNITQFTEEKFYTIEKLDHDEIKDFYDS